MMQFFKRQNPYFLIIAAVLLSTVVLYAPFILHFYGGLNLPDLGLGYIYQNFDGLLYIVPAKTWYNPEMINNIRLESPLPVEYYAAHLPLYPVFIALFAPLLGFVKSMVFSSILFSVLLACVFYYVVKHFKITQYPLALTLVFLFLPRFLIVRSVGAPESLFMVLILGSLFFFEKGKYLLAGLLGGFAAMTKTPAILLFFAYICVFVEQFIKTKKFNWNIVYMLLIPAGLLAVGILYAVQYQNFYAYFNTGGVVPLLYPFAAFNFQARWVGTPWLEDIIFYLFLYGVAVAYLKDIKYRSFFYFSLVFLIATSLVQHRDIARYALPMWPLACIALEKFFTSRKFLLVFIILLPAIYLFAWNFLFSNYLPVSDWSAFL